MDRRGRRASKADATALQAGERSDERLLVSGLHAEVEVFGHGELADTKLDRTLQLLFGLLVGNERAEGIVDSSDEGCGVLDVGAEVESPRVS